MTTDYTNDEDNFEDAKCLCDVGVDGGGWVIFSYYAKTGVTFIDDVSKLLEHPPIPSGITV